MASKESWNIRNKVITVTLAVIFMIKTQFLFEQKSHQYIFMIDEAGKNRYTRKILLCDKKQSCPTPGLEVDAV